MTATTPFPHVSRRARSVAWRITALALVALALGALGLTPRPATAQPTPQAGIERSWLVRLPDMGEEHQLASFLPGGVVLATNTPVERDQRSGAREYNTPGHGAWASLGGGRYAFTFVALIFDEDGTFTAMFNVDATVTLDTNGDRFSGSLTVRGMLPSGEQVFASPEFAIEATRIRPPAGR